MKKELKEFYDKKAKEILEYVKEKGLDPKETIFIEVDRERLLFAVANHFVNGIPHWSRGRNLIRQREVEKVGKFYEVVFNSTPAVAYVNSSSNVPEVLQVIAHVYGHAHIFKHNIYEYSDELILEKLRFSIETYEDKLKTHSFDELDVIVDFAFTAWNILIPNEVEETFAKEDDIKEEMFYNKKFDRFLGEKRKTLTHKEKVEEERRKQFRKEYGIGNRKIYEYILEHSPIDDWLKSLIRVELDLLKLIMKKSKIKIVHEGFASWIDQKYMLDNLESFDFFHSLIVSSKVGYPSLDNPYYLGYKLLTYAEQILKKDVPEYVKTVDDYELISECFNEEFFSLILKDLRLEESIAGEDKRELYEKIRNDLLGSNLLYSPIIFIDEYSSNLKSSDFNYLSVNSFSENRKLKLTSLTPLDETFAMETLKILEKVWRGPIELRYKRLS